MSETKTVPNTITIQSEDVKIMCKARMLQIQIRMARLGIHEYVGVFQGRYPEYVGKPELIRRVWNFRNVDEGIIEKFEVLVNELQGSDLSSALSNQSEQS